MSILHSNLSSIEDENLLRLFEELQRIIGQSIQSHGSMFVLHFLQDCIYCNGDGKPVRITKKCIDSFDAFDNYLVRKKVGKLGDSITQLCIELIANSHYHGDSVEQYSGTAFFTFLNKMIIQPKQKPSHRYFR